MFKEIFTLDNLKRARKKLNLGMRILVCDLNKLKKKY